MPKGESNYRKMYSEKLMDPRWQKKRLEVFERDNWTCLHCGNKERTMNVHHLRYARSGNPWDVECADLITLCDRCHERESTDPDTGFADLILRLRRHGISKLEFEVICGVYDSDGLLAMIQDLLYFLSQNAPVGKIWEIKEEPID